MAANSAISWCHHTFNPWIGCTKVSAACDHCYAERWGARFGVEWGNHERRLTGGSNWNQPYRWNRAAKAAGERHRVFCASLADVFDNQVPELWRLRLWRLIANCADLDWLLLTKRPQNISKMLPDGIESWGDGWPHVWIGTTVENQEEADRRIPHLLRVPAAKHFLSAEPLIGPLDLTSVHYADEDAEIRHDVLAAEAWVENSESAAAYSNEADGVPRLDWVIVGGESGPGARPMHPDWARSLRDQCQAAGVAFHFKQWGEWVDPREPHGYVKPHSLGPDAVRYVHDDGRILPIDEGNEPSMRLIHRVGKKAAGRLLDGREWKEFPT